MPRDVRQAGLRVLIALCAIVLSRAAQGAGEASVFDDPTAFPVASKPANPAATGPATRLPPPDAAAKAKVLKTIKQIYDKEYEQKSPTAKHVLAGELLTEADKVRVNFAARFVLLQEALAAAVSAADVADCRKAVDGLDQTFNIDTTVLTTDAINKLSEAGADDTAIANWSVDAIERHIDQDDYLGARRLSRSLSSKVARSKDPATVVKFKSLEALLAEYDRIHLALEKLKTDPRDPAANNLGGKFYCFSKHDWEHGLPMLARGTDAKLKEVALKDLANPTDASARYELAGLWWDLGHDKMHATLEPRLHERAAYWYDKALPELTALPKAMAEKRIAEVESETGVAVNVLRHMVVEGRSQALPDGSIRLDNGNLKFPTQLVVPFRIDTVVKTTSPMCAIRLLFANGMVSFNGEEDVNELAYNDPHNGQARLKGKGTVPIDQFVHIAWVLNESGSRIFVDGEERASVKGNHKDMAGFFFFNIWNRPAIVVKSVSVTQLAASAGEH